MKNILLLMYLLIIYSFISCSVAHEHKGIPDIPNEITVNVEHGIDLEAIEAFCELQDGNTQDCIDNMIRILVQFLDSSQNSDTSNVASN